MLPIDAGTWPDEKIIKTRISVSGNDLRFDFLYNDKMMKTDQTNPISDPVVLHADQTEPTVIHLYEPFSNNEPTTFAVLRPGPKFVTSLEISVTKLSNP
ncbi:MAG: hypothetical protein DI551_01290 [Micavibrio aeruginosavorus]|uniref:Uncharacterized protein n=1 Tax=Micavibrio aeruginosavorus TaxID=349221 RepID=A0A2W5N591_9BACT|nr:MAG: hypothetical protein DI551_01290 [Micavibrio aeruginosavorus]